MKCERCEDEGYVLAPVGGLMGASASVPCPECSEKTENEALRAKLEVAVKALEEIRTAATKGDETTTELNCHGIAAEVKVEVSEAQQQFLRGFAQEIDMARDYYNRLAERYTLSKSFWNKLRHKYYFWNPRRDRYCKRREMW